MADNVNVLLVEDSTDDAEILLRSLKRGGLDVLHERVQTADTMRQALLRRPWDIIISDFFMPQFDGISAFSLLKESGYDIPFIFVSGTLGEETAVEAMHLGVSDYFVKGSLKRLVPAIRREMNKQEERRRRKDAETALVRIEHELRQAQKMEAMGRLAGGVAHDFNNLLTVILGHAQILSEDPPESREELSQGLVEIKKCAERGASLTQQLLAFGRRQPLQRVAVDLNAVVGEMGLMLRRLVGETISLELRLPENLPKVMADPNQVGQVLMNLVINSRDAMPKGGQILVETSLKELQADDLVADSDLHPGPYAMLMVQDNGYGMSEEVRQHMFEPFYTTKGPGQGTGLGLAMVYGIIKQSHGHLSVESEQDRGTVFKIYLPLAQDQAEQKNTKKNLAPSTLRGTETVLVVEDDPSLRNLVGMVLRRYGYRVLDASGAEEALKIADEASQPIDLMLTDLTMPQMNGRELSRIMASRHPSTRLLLMTGYIDPDSMAEMEESNTDYLMKPFSADILGSKVREIFQKNRES